MRPLAAVLTLALAFGTACGGGGEDETTDTTPPRAQPTTATLTEVETADVT